MSEAPSEPRESEPASGRPPRPLPQVRTSAQPPSEPRPPSTHTPSAAAGGFAAVTATARHGLGEMGLVRTVQTLLRVNQKDGFDCPGCAWPDPEERAMVEFCENGAKAVAEEATRATIGPEFFARWTIDELAGQSDHWLGKQGRLTHPMVRRAGAARYEPISWDEAYGLLAQELAALSSPDEAVFYTSGRTSNEAAFLYQLFVRAYGTNNLPDCSNMCHESSGKGLGEVIGIGKGTVTLEDFDRAQAIFVIGQNPGTNHPRMLTALQSAKRKGAKIVTINPLREPGLLRFRHPQEVSGLLGSGTELTDLYLQVRINGDVALLKGIMKEVLAEEDRRPGEVLDRAFIDEHSSGFVAFEAALRAADWDELVRESGVSRADMKAAAEVYVAADSVIACWAMGLTQHKNGVANIQEVVNFLLLRGNMGRPGAGACPVRGHSNVQGDRTMGIWEAPPAAFLDALRERFGFEPPRAHGFDTVAALRAMHEGRAKVFFAMGGNFLSATPDTEFTAEAMRRCRLTAYVSTKLNRAHLITGEQALILPCLGRTEVDVQGGAAQFVTVENSMGFVHRSQGRLAPASSELRSEPAIVCDLARAVLGEASGIPWAELAGDYDRTREAIEACLPGFADYNRRVREGGFYLPNGARERVFKTADGKAGFTVHPLPEDPLGPGQFLMMTVRSHDQYNTTIYGLDDRYRGIKQGRRVVFLAREDVAELGLSAGQKVDLTSHFQGETRLAREFVVVPYDMPRRSAATYFPEANVLVPIGHYADRSHTPASKSVVISLAPSA